jgi:hypothetical protein
VLNRRNILLQSLGIYLSQGLDWATTTLAISAGGSEGNPVVAAVLDRVGTDGFLLGKMAIATFFVAVCARRRNGHTIAWLLTLMFSAVALWNLFALGILLNASLL